jgi:NADH-quinone oxidoreductase subunit E
MDSGVSCQVITDIFLQEEAMPAKSLDKILANRRSQPNQLIEVLQDVQDTIGYISKDSMEAVSRALGVPLIEVYRVASFYKAFRLKPAGKTMLTICLGTACHVRNAGLVFDQASTQLGVKQGEITADGIFSIECVNCVGACALGPIVKENEVYHHHMTPGKIRKLIENKQHRAKEVAYDKT